MSEYQNHDDFIMSPNNTSPFYPNGSSDPVDDFQLQEQLSFLNDGSSDSSTLFSSYGYGGNSLHRRSCSVNDACLGSEDPNSGLGWKPCLYFARGYCKNGTSCRFLHGGDVDAGSATIVDSPNKVEMMDQCHHHELLRSKSSHQQRLAAASQLMASNSFPYSPKCMNFLLQQQQNDTQRYTKNYSLSLVSYINKNSFFRFIEQVMHLVTRYISYSINLNI
jgi:hypothetical protein